MGFYWRTSEAIVDTKDGVVRAGTIRRVGAHRRWDAEGPDAVRGVPWKWDPDAEEVTDRLLVRLLSKDEKKHLAGPAPEAGPKIVYRMSLKRDDFVEKGFTEGCLGCKAILSGGGVRGHSEACRRRMEELMQKSSEGQARLKRQTDPENEYLSRVLEANDQKEPAWKKVRSDVVASPEGGAPGGAAADRPKRNPEGDDERGELKRPKPEEGGQRRPGGERG